MLETCTKQHLNNVQYWSSGFYRMPTEGDRKLISFSCNIYIYIYIYIYYFFVCLFFFLRLLVTKTGEGNETLRISSSGLANGTSNFYLTDRNTTHDVDSDNNKRLVQLLQLIFHSQFSINAIFAANFDIPTCLFEQRTSIRPVHSVCLTNFGQFFKSFSPTPPPQ